jgi:cell division protein FtsB
MKMTFKKFILLTTSLSFLLLCFYVFQIQVVMGNDYKVEGYENDITELSKNNSFLEVKVNEFDSLETIENKIKNLQLVKVGEVKYILISKDYLAREIQ